MSTWGFNTSDELHEYVRQFGMDALRDVARGSQLQISRRAYVLRWIAEQDAAETAKRTAVENGAMLAEAKRSADAAESQARSARKAVCVSYWALAISVIALLVAGLQVALSVK